MGFLGTTAGNFSDLSLLLEVLIVLVFIFGARYARRALSNTHHSIMLWGFLANVAFVGSYMIYTSLIKTGSAKFMGPQAVKTFVYIPVAVIHGLGSTIAFILAGYTVYYGIKHTIIKERRVFSSKEERVKHKKLGTATIFSWSAALISGIIVYLLLYVIY